MDRPENEKEFLMLYFDDQANLQTWVGVVLGRGCGAGGGSASRCWLHCSLIAPCALLTVWLPCTCCTGGGGPPAGGHPVRLPARVDLYHGGQGGVGRGVALPAAGGLNCQALAELVPSC